jgi:hypothetical protein
MKTLTIRRFTREFPKVLHEPLTVTRRGQMVGTWTPAQKKAPAIDLMKRLKSYCSGPLPFTGAELIREGRRR